MADWTRAYARAAGIKWTPEVGARLEQWQRWEGGHTHNSARNNYMNSKLPMPGSWDAIGNGVQGYKTLAQGALAFGRTLGGRSDYAPLKAWLATGQGDPSNALQVWVAGPGGVGSSSATAYAQKVLGGGGTVPSAPAPSPGQTRAIPTTLGGDTSSLYDGGTTDYQALARSYRNKAVAGLAAIASGQKATDVFSQTGPPPSPALAHAIGKMPVVLHDTNNSVEASAAALVQKYLGVKYVWGGESPSGFDCSGLLQYVWHALGVTIPRTSQMQWKAGRPVDLAHLKPGDAVFAAGSDGTPDAPGHVGMYIGDGKIIAAPHTGTVVQVQNLSDWNAVGARRFA